MKSDIQTLKEAANKLILACPLQEKRLALAHYFSLILMEANMEKGPMGESNNKRFYKGFSYVAWRDGGYDQWVKDGKPDDNTKYLGDKSMVYFI